jgi:hypothetical protein
LPVQRRAQIPQENLLDFMNFIVQLGGFGLLLEKNNNINNTIRKCG